MQANNKTENQTALRLKNLACERDERILFKGVDLEFVPGDIVQVAGPNGAGKTTLLKLIIGTIPPLEGEICWQYTGSDGIAVDLHACLLFLGHQPSVSLSLTAMENLRWYFGLNGRKQANGSSNEPGYEDYRQALTQVGLSGYEDVQCNQMSAGQHRRVALARLYLSEAPLWILDEPFTAIDKSGVTALQQRIKSHSENGGIVLLTTHQPLQLEGVKVLDISEYQAEMRRGSDS